MLDWYFCLEWELCLDWEFCLDWELVQTEDLVVAERPASCCMVKYCYDMAGYTNQPSILTPLLASEAICIVIYTSQHTLRALLCAQWSHAFFSSLGSSWLKSSSILLCSLMRACIPWLAYFFLVWVYPAHIIDNTLSIFEFYQYSGVGPPRPNNW